MRKLYKEALSIFLEGMISSEMPIFKKIKISSQERRINLIPREYFIYEKKLEKIAFYLHFIPLDDDSVQIEVGWSEKLKFPSSISRFPIFQFKDEYISQKEFLFDLNICSDRANKTSELSWSLWNCAVTMPFVDLAMKNNINYMLKYEREYQQYKEAYIAEAIRVISLDEALNNTKRALADLASEIKICVFPIFEKKKSKMNHPSQNQ